MSARRSRGVPEERLDPPASSGAQAQPGEYGQAVAPAQDSSPPQGTAPARTPSSAQGTVPGRIEVPASPAAGEERRPVYPRLLRLRHVHPNAWQRAALGEGAVVTAGLLVMADLASAWSLVVLPVAVAGLVKGHDVLAGLLERASPDR